MAPESKISARGSRGKLTEGESGSQDVQEGILSRVEQELCRDSGVLFKGIFLVSSKSAGTLAPVPASSAVGIPSMREVHPWDSH